MGSWQSGQLPSLRYKTDQKMEFCTLSRYDKQNLLVNLLPNALRRVR